jgi:recombination protein RecA
MPPSLLIQPGSAEEALNAISRMIDLKHPEDKSRSLFDVIVLDSVAALTTVAELAGDVGDQVVAGRAKVLSQFLGKVKHPLAASTTALVLLNQVRDFFGASFGYGVKYNVPGGRAVSFYSVIKAQMKSQDAPTLDKATGQVVARSFRFHVKKNQVSSPERDATVKVYIDSDHAYCDTFSELATVGHALNLFTRENGEPIKGPGIWWFRQDDQMIRLGNGEAQVIQALNDNRELAKEIEGALRVLIAGMNHAAPIGTSVILDDVDEGDDPASGESPPADLPHEAAFPEDGGDLPPDDREEPFVPIENL